MRSIEKKITRKILELIRRRRGVHRPPQNTPPEASVSPARLREARFSDFGAVNDLKRRCRLSPDSLENWNRLWRHNPALRELRTDRPIGWVLESEGRVVGYLGNISLSYQFGSTRLTAVVGSGLAVDGPYRALSLILVAAFYRQTDVDLYLATTAIEAVGKMTQVFKSRPLPQSDYDTYLFWVLRPFRFAEGFTKKLSLGPLASRLGASLISAMIIFRELLSRNRSLHPSSELVVSENEVSEIGDDFHDLWLQRVTQRPCLFADRSPAVLRWYFQIPGDRGCARIIACRRRGKLVGYAVIRHDPSHGGQRKSTLADLLVINDDPEVIEALWSAAHDQAKRAGSDVLEVFGFPREVRNVFLQWKPYQRKLPAIPFYYKAADPTLQLELSAGHLWYASPYDGDTTLIRPSFANPTEIVAIKSAR